MKQALKQMYLSKFSSTKDSSIFQVKSELTKAKGDKITFGLRMKLSGAGVTGDSDIETAEEAMVFYDDQVVVDLRMNAVKAAGKMTLQRTAYNIKAEAKDALADWAAEILDEDMVYALSGIANAAGTIAVNAPSTNRVWYGGQTSAGVVTANLASDAAITSSTDHLFGTKVISLIKRKAKAASPKIRPVMVDGKEMYVILISPLQNKSLRADADWLNAQRNANWRGSKNPIFDGADGVWDNVVVHEYDRILTRALGESFEAGDVCGIATARALFCGAQAGVIGWAQYLAWYEKMFQYGRVPGVATDMIYGVKKTEYNSEDFGVIAVDTAIVED